jgi:PAS domain S-box-containing protein
VTTLLSPSAPTSAPLWLGVLTGALAAGGLAALLLARASHRQRLAIDAVVDALHQQQRTSRLLTAIAQCSPDALYAKDLEGRFLYFNRAAETMCGVSAERLIGNLGSEVFTPEQLAQIHAVEQRVIDSGHTESYEVERDTPIGHRCFTRTKSPLREADGRVIGTIGISHDVTQRRESEQQLRLLSLAVEQSTESIVIADLQARIVYANQATLASTGYAREELLGCNLRMLQSGKTPAETYAAMWSALMSGQNWKGFLFNRRKDGSEYVEFAVMTPVRSPQGRITHFISVKEDVTEKQRMGAELDHHRLHLEELVGQRTAELAQAKRVAEAANAAKSSFLATMSHEIRTPMNSIVGLSEVLGASPLSAQQSDLLHTIRESSFALLEIIDDLLDFSKIEAGCLVLERANVDLRALVEGACDGLQAGAAGRELLLTVFIDPALPRAVATDALRVRQIINNLVGNAIKFSIGLSRPGRVGLRVDSPQPGQLRLSVVDNGIGMDQAAQARVFEPFVQAEDSTTRRYGGTGLGLSIVHKLVQAFGGSLQVHSVPDQGSSFVVLLPLEAVASPAAPAANALELPQIDCHLLIGDDEIESDWAAYLHAAGANAFAWPDAETLRAGLYVEPSADSVLLLGEALSAAVRDDALQLAESSGMALVCVGRGARRTPYAGPAGGLRIDADALHRDTLLQAVAVAAGRRPPLSSAGDGAVTETPALPSADEAMVQGRLVLVAEDNPVNQTVIRLQLEMLGLASEMVDDGLQALDLWRSGRFALLLTDLHMPGLDGYALARHIRAEESGPTRFPVIAITASASDDEGERCRAAGMDAYVSKPVTRQRLAEVLGQWLPLGDAAASPPPAAAEATAATVLDEAALPALVGHDAAVLLRIRREFLASARGSADALRAAVGAGRWAEAGAVAHRMKSSSGAVGAVALSALCARIEAAVQRDDAASVQLLHGAFDAALGEVHRRMAPLLSGPAALPTVFLVDDDPFQLQVLQQQLSSLTDAPVEMLQSGRAALARVQGCDCSRALLMLDLSMPGMDGVELMRRLASGGYAGALVLVSAAEERVIESVARLAAEHRLNLIGHLHKPASVQALRALIERWQGGMRVPERSKPRRYVPRELSDALQHDQLRVHYQPKVSLADGRLVGVEALVRWQHPSDGLVYPDSFIAMAEERGLIDALTMQVLAIAIAQARRWRDQGLAPCVAVNVSMDNLVRLDFPERVLELLAQHGLEPEALRLEVTESRLLKDQRPPLDILTRLRLNRIGLAIDDFGTGHSSLAQLRDLPFDELKIDRGFVHGCSQSTTRRAIVKASIEMAHQLGMQTVAEGVEDAADWDTVREAGCDVAQGYYIARPMTADLLPAWAAGFAKRFPQIA